MQQEKRQLRTRHSRGDGKVLASCSVPVPNQIAVGHSLLKYGYFRGQVVNASSNLKQLRWSLKLPHIFFNARLASFCSVQAIRASLGVAVEALGCHEEQQACVEKAFHT
jgi:hypothetical protein